MNIGEYINCYNETEEGYYLDNINKIFKNCYVACKSCNLGGNDKIHNCLNCNENFPLRVMINNYYNCYDSCPKEYPKLIENKNECTEFDIEDIINNIFENEKNKTEKSKEEEINYYDNILKSIEKGFTSNNYNTSDIDNGQDQIIQSEKLTITFTTTQNQRNNIYNNVTKIDLGECEDQLRKNYNISDNEKLYMKKIDIIQEGIKTSKVEYDVYAKLFGTKLIKLNLTVCGKSKISISIPIIINEPLDKYNSTSGYYNDICYTTTSEDGTDILLKDRQKEFINKDKIVCQEDCDFSEYDYETLVAKCSCEVKESSETFADMNINKNKLLENFKNIKNIINFNFLKCYDKLFNREGFINNIGCFILLAIIFFHILSIFIFIMNQFSSLINKINNISDLSQSAKYPLIKKEEKIDKRKTHRNKGKKNSNHKYNNKKLNKKNHIYDKKYRSDSKTNFHSKNTENFQSRKESIKKFIDEEINRFSYYFAIQYDKRTYCQYYASLLKTQHSLLSALFNNNDYNSGIIKINLFFIGFTTEYILNALFYNDDTMHEIYESKGAFDLDTQLPIAVYSTIISMVINFPLNYLALSNDAIINFKQDNTKINLLKKSKDLIKILTIKFISYFIISFLFLLFFWYYISMFGVIYRNTQIHLLKDTLMSFGFSLILPFFIYLFPGMLRIPSLSKAKKKRECLYNFSKFLQSF